MVYTILFLIGLIGLGAMLLLGFGHGAGGHAGHVGHDAHGGHIGHDGAHAGHGHAGHGHEHGHGPHDEGERSSMGWFWSLLSPMSLMSLCLGAGATGMVLQERHLPGLLTAIASAIGAVAFYALVVRPLFSLAFKFVSQPSKALEGTTAQTALAEGKFDESGRGVVKLNVDGQVVRVLAELEQDDRLDAGLIRPGDPLTVTAVDGRTNTCRVARL